MARKRSGRKAQWAEEGKEPPAETGPPTSEDELGDELAEFVAWASEERETRWTVADVALTLYTLGIRTGEQLEENRALVLSQWDAAAGDFDAQVWDALEAYKAVTPADLERTALLVEANDVVRGSPAGREAHLAERADRLAPGEDDDAEKGSH